MNSNVRTDACDPDRVESFLRGELSDAQEREFALHLTACESCRRALEQQAAEPQSWVEAERLLRPSPFDSPVADEVPDSESAGRISRPPPSIQSVLEALGPTDDPEMLGRIGGYEVSGVVGAGGMGVVLKAIDRPLDRTVAVKVLARHLATSGAARKRFAREAKAAAAVLHPNVIAIHGVSNDDALPYLVMPYVRGASLQKRLDEEGPLPVKEILRIGSQIAAGLAAAHAQGLVHRDIKPANILLEEGVERVTITDFGLARAVDDATITHSGTIAGTPQYMSPEQVRGEAVEQRSDLFSLGSVLYAICTGRPPFRGDSTYGVMRRITDDEPASIRSINPDIPEWMCAIVERLMSKRASDRLESAAEVAELLEKCLAHVQQPDAVPLPAFLVPRTIDRRRLFNSRRKGVIAMLAVVGFGILSLVLMQATNAPENSGETAKRSPVPKGAHIGGNDGSVMVVHDDVDMHYVLYHAGDFGTSLGGSHNTRSLTWVNKGSVTLKDGTPFGYDRESVDPFHLRVNGKEYDLRQGRVLELFSGGSVKQIRQFPALSTARAPEALAKLIASTRAMYEEPFTREKRRLQLDVARSQLQDLLKTHSPSHELVVEVGRLIADLQQKIEDQTVEAPAPRQMRRIQTGDRVATIAASADGRFVAFANDHRSSPRGDDWKPSVEILDTGPGKTIVSLKLTTEGEDALLAETKRDPHFLEVEALAFSPDGNAVAVGTRVGQVKLFDVRTGALIRSLDDEAAKRADQRTPEKLKALARAMGSATSIAFSPDGSLLAVCGGAIGQEPLVQERLERTTLRGTGPGHLKVWEVKTGAIKHDLVGHSHANAVAFSPDGNLLASAGNWTGHEYGTGVIIWNPQTGAKIRTIANNANGGTWAVAFSPNSKLVAISARIFDKDNDTSTSAMSLAHARTGIVEWQRTVPAWGHPVTFTPDGKAIAVLCGGQSIRFFAIETGAMPHELRQADNSEGGSWTAFAITTQGARLVIGGANNAGKGTVEFWEFDRPGGDE